MNTRFVKAYSCITLFICFNILDLFSQTQINDPLNNPLLWKKILDTPTDMQLWSAYLGKNLNSLDNEDEQKIVAWCSQLKVSIPANVVEEKVWMELAKEHHYSHSQKTTLDLEYKIFHKQLKEHILQSSPVLTELQTNIEANFIIIEDIIRLEFEELGTRFIDYQTSFPDNSYPKDKWITEKNLELAELKLLNLEVIKSQITSQKN